MWRKCERMLVFEEFSVNMLAIPQVDEFKRVVTAIIESKNVEDSVLKRHKSRGKLLARERIEHLIGMRS
jgi:acetyl-CoA carboxylase carboxyltransferase component